MTPTAPEPEPVSQPAPINGVIFDFHGTLVDLDNGGPASWVAAALRHLGDDPKNPALLAPQDVAGLSAHLDQIWQHASTIDPNSERDLSASRHREVFGQTLALYPGAAGLPAELIDALYTVMPQEWAGFADTEPVLRELNARGVRIVVLSNIGIDIRECLQRAGVADVIDGVVLSFEVGVVKPDPAIFGHALELLKVPAGEALMVGDNWRDDGGAAQLGIRTLILPKTSGPVHGLGAVLKLVGTG